MANVKLLLGVGFGGIWTFGSYSYRLDSIEEINTKYIIETTSLQHITYKGIQFDSLADIEIRYRTRLIGQDYEGDGSYTKYGSTSYGTYGSYSYVDGTVDVLDTSSVGFVESGTRAELNKLYTLTDDDLYYPRYRTTQVSVEYKTSNGTWASLSSIGGYRVSDTTSSTSYEEKSITIESFGITDSIVAFGENYHLILDIVNIYDYEITMALVNGVEYDLIHMGEIINTDQYVLQFTNNAVNSSVVELLSSKTIEELYVNGNWLDIEDITAEHILRTIDNTGYNEQISDLQEQINSMTSELNRIIKEKETAQSNIDIIDIQIEQGIITINNLEKSKNELQIQIANLTDEMNVLTYERNAALLLLDDLNNNIVASEGDLAKLEQEKDKLQLQLNSMQSELDHLNEELESAQDELDSLNSQIGDAIDSLELITQSKIELQTEIDNKTIQLEQLNSELKIVEATIDSKLEMVETLNNELEAAQQVLDSINHQIENSEGNLLELEQTRIEMESQIENLLSDLSQLNEELANIQTILEIMLDEKNKLNNELADGHETLELLNQQIALNEEKLGQLAESEAAVANQIDEMIALLDTLNNQQLTGQQALDSINKEIEYTSAELKLLEETKSDLDQEIGETTEELSKLYFEQENVLLNLDLMKQLIEENANDLNKLNERKIELELMIDNFVILSDSLREELCAYDEAIENRQSELDMYEKQKEELMKEIEELEAKRANDMPWYKSAWYSFISLPSKVFESLFG